MIMQIKQHIVGTGGTELDKKPTIEGSIMNTIPTKKKTYELQYNLLKDIEKKFGFLKCRFQDGVLQFDFISANTSGGKKRNTKKNTKKNTKRNTKKNTKRNTKRKKVRKLKFLEY